MSQDSRLQMALAHDAQFLNRVQVAMAVVALQVVNEDVATPNHVLRRAYAASVLGNPAAAAVAFAVGLVGSVNLTAPVTTVNFDGSVISGASDADIASEVATLWNAYAGA